MTSRLRTTAKASMKQRGMVLVLVLWVLVAMSLLALSFAVAIRTEVDASRNVVSQKQAYYLARAGINYAVYKILESQASLLQPQQQLGDGDVNSLPELFTGQLELQLSNGTAQIQVTPETGKINLNSDDENLIFNLLIMVGVGQSDAEVIADSISDWKDADTDVREFGAEDGYYQSLQEPYRAKNASFDVPEELLLIQGVTPEIYYGEKVITADGQRLELYGLQKYLTTFGPAQSRVDVNAAPLQVLAAIPGLEYQDAVAIFEMRPIQDVSQILSRVPGLETNVLTYMTVQRNAVVYTLDSLGRLKGDGAVSRIRCVIQVGGLNSQGYSVFYWNESNTEL